MFRPSRVGALEEVELEDCRPEAEVRRTVPANATARALDGRLLVKKRDNVARQDLRSVLRLFAEVASSVDHDEGARAPERHDLEQGGEDLSGMRSSTEGAKYRDT